MISARNEIISNIIVKQEFDLVVMASEIHKSIKNDVSFSDIIVQQTRSKLAIYTAALELRFSTRSKKKYLASSIKNLTSAYETYRTSGIAVSSKSKALIGLVLEQIIDGLEDHTEEINRSEVRHSGSKKQLRKFELNVSLSAFMLIVKQLSKEGVFSMSEPDIGEFLENNFIQKNGKPITENTVTTMFSKTIGDRSHKEAIGVLRQASNSI
jgi:hypothetical protein